MKEISREDKLQELITLSQKMFDLTKGECTRCPKPHSCCDAVYCQAAANYAKGTWGIDLPKTNHPTLPFMGPQGCTVPPHLRPICTVHTCEVSSLGFKRGDPEWTKRYFELREAIDTLLWETVVGEIVE